MHRTSLLELLRKYNPSDEYQRDCKEGFIEFVKTHPKCFERSLKVGHITGSAFITDPARKKMILVHHRKLGMWLQPGGHADGESDVRKVALLEAIEETGLQHLRGISDLIFDLDIHRIPRYKDTPGHYHYDVRFYFEADPVTPLKSNSESHDVRWVTFSEAENFTSEESILRMIRKLHNSIV